MAIDVKLNIGNTTLHDLGKKIRIGCLASGSGSNFENIQNAISAGYLNTEIVCVIYNVAGAGVVDRADRLGISKVLINHKDYGDRETHDQAVVDKLNEYDIDLVVMAGWMRIATSNLVNAFMGRMINLHPSLLPLFKGLHAIEQTFEAYEQGKLTVGGCTVHLVSEDLDSGRVLIQKPVQILPSYDVGTYTYMIHQAEYDTFPIAIKYFSRPQS